MTENKKARSGVAPSEQASERALEDGTFCNHSNTNKRGIQAFLLEGEANAMPMRELARLMGVSERQVRKLAERERDNGAFVIASDKGYFLPSADNPEYDLKRYIHRMDARVSSNRKAIRTMRKRFDELRAQANGQERLEL